MRQSVLLLVATSGVVSAAKSHAAPPTGPVLRVTVDQSGGGPYSYPAEDDPTRIIGFEVDLAAALGEELGRPIEYVQRTWDQMLPVLSRGDVDLVLNGYEYTQERAQQYLASLPYYIYELGLCARQSDDSIRGWDDLNKLNPDGTRRRVGVLEASAADRYVTENYGTTCTVFRFEASTEAFRLIESGQLDATLQDLPIIQFYVTDRRMYPQLKVIPELRGEGYYVAYARPNDERLITEVNDAFRRLYQNGRLRDIYERYHIWTDTQDRLPQVWQTWETGLRAASVSKWHVLALQIVPLLKAAGVTVLLSVISMPLAVMIGLTLALIRSWDSRVLGGTAGAGSLWHRLLLAPATLYIEIVRGTPLAFQLFVVYFVLPSVGVTVGAFWAGVIALSINYSAYEAEIFRLGLQAISPGQMEAALSLGMPRTLAVRRIILPQAIRIVIPATANDFIALFKDTAVCSVIAVEELSKQYSMGAKSTGLFVEMALMASVLYLLMSYPLSRLSRWLEARLKRQ